MVCKTCRAHGYQMSALCHQPQTSLRLLAFAHPSYPHGSPYGFWKTLRGKDVTRPQAALAFCFVPTKQCSVEILLWVPSNKALCPSCMSGCSFWSADSYGFSVCISQLQLDRGGSTWSWDFTRGRVTLKFIVRSFGTHSKEFWNTMADFVMKWQNCLHFGKDFWQSSTSKVNTNVLGAGVME